MGLNILFLGEKRIAQNCISALLSEYDMPVKAIVTNSRFYNGLCCNFPKMSNSVFISNDTRNSEIILDIIKSLDINVLISIQHNWILPISVLNAVKGMAFNLHNAKLPNYKGYNSISHAIIDGQKEFTTTIHWMHPKVDEGDIIIEKATSISQTDTALSLYKKTLTSANISFIEFIDMLLHNNLPKIPMQKGGVFYKKSDLNKYKLLEFGNSDEYIERIVRACYFPPYEPAYYKIKGQKYYILPDEPFKYTFSYSNSDWE